MQRPRLQFAGLLVLAFLLNSCGDEGSGPPTPPDSPTGHNVTGSVQLVSHLTNDLGAMTGMETIDDANGIRVYCRHGQGGLDSVSTVDGHFTFSAVPAGACTLYTAIATAEHVTEVPFDMPAHDHAMMESLVLEPSGDLRIYPNPSPDEGSGIEFTTHTTGPYLVSVHNLQGETIWSYGQNVTPGFYHVHWAGMDQAENEVEPGPYWVVAEFDGQAVYGIVLWGHDHGVPSPGNCGHIEAEGIVLAHHDERLVTCWHGECSGSLDVTAGQASHGLQVLFLDADSTAYAIADTCPDNKLTWTVSDSSVATLRLATGTKWEIEVVGKRAGATDVILHGWHEDHIHINSPSIPIVVGSAVAVR